MQLARSVVAIAAIGALAGCVIEGPGSGVRQPAPPADPFQGNWQDTGGVATSSFLNGRFVSTANDSGNQLAQGTYQRLDDRNVQISFFSNLRQTQMRTNCLLATQNQLNCTSESGQQFSLTRQIGVS